MIIGSRRKKPSPAESRRERLRVARLTAPLLRDLHASAASVSVQLTSAGDTRLAPETRSFAVYPPARAYFVYPCAFRDCDGRHDLDEVVRALLRAGISQTSGVRQCPGHRPGAAEQGPPCGLGLTYTISVAYQAYQDGKSWQPTATA